MGTTREAAQDDHEACRPKPPRGREADARVGGNCRLPKEPVTEVQRFLDAVPDLL